MLLSGSACATSSGVYNKELFSDSRYKNNLNLSSYLWIKSSKEVKRITNKGEMFSVKYWPCTHYGVHAVLFLGPYPDIDTENINTLFVMLANIALDQDQVKIIEHFIDKKLIAVSKDKSLFQIKNHEYSEFYLSYTVANDSLVLEIKLYQN